jgi:hypothetical protein
MNTTANQWLAVVSVARRELLTIQQWPAFQRLSNVYCSHCSAKAAVFESGHCRPGSSSWVDHCTLASGVRFKCIVSAVIGTKNRTQRMIALMRNYFTR